MKNQALFLNFFMAILLFSSCKKEDSLPDEPTISKGCEIDFLRLNSEFTSKLNFLVDDAKKLNYETGYLLYHSKTNGFNYQKIEGNPEEASIVFAPKGQIDGLIHSHYGNLYPNFSGSDIKAIYEAYYYEKMNDYQKFIAVVASGYDTSYLLKISDLNKFLTFSNKYLIEKNSFVAFETKYHTIQKAGQTAHGINQSFENALLQILSTSGLTLYKSIAPFHHWIRLEWKENNTTNSTSCW
ncbi:hypothetical protein [Sphingobacterium anhuiense]|uniref:hypothetical protein n=1 Tax=Sphingobacterium anhuiense TaxID=493780 RepID=UPI003C2FC95F